VGQRGDGGAARRKVGSTLDLPLRAGAPVTVRVLGVWRDFARQFGSVVIDHATYRRLTGDER
jgi:putative ABC transport system permease protein